MDRRKAISTLLKGFGLLAALAAGVRTRSATPAEDLSALNARARKAGESVDKVSISLDLFDRHVEEAVVRVYRRNGELRRMIKNDI